MAKWRVKPNNDRLGGTVHGTFEYDSGTVGGEAVWSMTQDTRPFIEQAKIDRETLKMDKTNGMKKFASIPDVVAVDIKLKWGLDLHQPDFMHDKERMAKFMTIIRQEYPYLLSTT